MLRRNNDFSHIIIGGGVVGLAIAARLSSKSSNRVLLLERHGDLGTETSSRNSEVIHAGLYYPIDSLKTKLCIRGNHLLYLTAKKYGISYENCGKWIVAQDTNQAEYLQKLFEKSKQTGVLTKWLSLKDAKKLEPAVKVGEAILESPNTGIISSHMLMNFFNAQIQENEADISLRTNVFDINYVAGKGYEIHCSSGEGKERSMITSDSVINSAGLSAPLISNMILPASRHVKPYYAKGNYFAYTASKPKISRLIYPCPSDHAGLGTHLTLDLDHRMKFGPDVEWVDSPDDLRVNDKNLKPAIQEISKYIDLDFNELVSDYAGIRPKLSRDSKNFQDFIIRHEKGFPGFINLLGIESPGLTSSMAIAEHVEKLF